MTVWLAGMRVTADRLNDHTLEDSTTSGATAATGFSLTSFSGRRVNGITTVVVVLSRTGANIGETAAGTGNISNTDIATLPSGWRPPETLETIFNNGVNDGAVTIATNGVMTADTTSGSSGIENGSTIRVCGMWISEND